MYRHEIYKNGELQKSRDISFSYGLILLGRGVINGYNVTKDKDTCTIAFGHDGAEMRHILSYIECSLADDQRLEAKEHEAFLW